MLQVCFRSSGITTPTMRILKRRTKGKTIRSFPNFAVESYSALRSRVPRAQVRALAAAIADRELVERARGLHMEPERVFKMLAIVNRCRQRGSGGPAKGGVLSVAGRQPGIVRLAGSVQLRSHNHTAGCSKKSRHNGTEGAEACTSGPFRSLLHSLTTSGTHFQPLTCSFETNAGPRTQRRGSRMSL